MRYELNSIVFIGSGKVATSLSLSLKEKNKIVQVYSKTLAHARKLSRILGCSYTNDINKLNRKADIYIIAVKDDAIEEVCKQLNLKGKIVAHTSGSVEMNVLKKCSDKFGVIYPLHSFVRRAPFGTAKTTPSPTPYYLPLTPYPFFIESSDLKTRKQLVTLAKQINGRVFYLNSEKRAMLHLAAVFINNFPNHLFAIAETISKEAGIPFKEFHPLVKDTVENILTRSPSLTQTGPAIRNDKAIINKHLALLAENTKLGKVHPIYKEIYRLLTKSIELTMNGKL